MALGHNIKRLREAQGLTQEELAVKAGGKVTQGIVAALEKRDSKASQYAARIAAALGVSVDELLTGESQPPNQSAASALAPRQQAFLALLNGLTEGQQEEEFRRLQDQKQQNEELLTELLKRRA